MQTTKLYLISTLPVAGELISASAASSHFRPSLTLEFRCGPIRKFCLSCKTNINPYPNYFQVVIIHHSIARILSGIELTLISRTCRTYILSEREPIFFQLGVHNSFWPQSDVDTPHKSNLISTTSAPTACNKVQSKSHCYLIATLSQQYR
jgi:hypothetical protein